MNLLDRLKALGDIEVPLSVVVMVVAITVLSVSKPQKVVHYVLIDSKSQKIHSI